MLKGTLSYATNMKGIQFDGMEIEAPDPTVEEVQLASDGNELRITVNFSAVGSQDEARAIAARVIEPILDRLAFTVNVAVGFPRPLSGAFSEITPDDSPDRKLFVSDHLYLTDKATAVRVMHLNAVMQLKVDLERPTSLGERHYGAFRQALNAESIVDQYVSLYRILLDLRRSSKGNESWKAVDDFIHTEFGVPLVAPTHRPDDPESVYTRLRNEVSHTRPGVVPENTRQEIRNHLSGLINIVKRAIELT